MKTEGMKNDEFRMQWGEILNAINSAAHEGRPQICHFPKQADTLPGRTEEEEEEEE